MTTEQILQECKDEISMENDYLNWSEMENDFIRDEMPYSLIKYANKAAVLYAQKIAELFSEWIRTFDVLQVDPSNREWFVESQISDEQLYQLFISQLNSTK